MSTFKFRHVNFHCHKIHPNISHTLYWQVYVHPALAGDRLISVRQESKNNTKFHVVVETGRQVCFVSHCRTNAVVLWHGSHLLWDNDRGKPNGTWSMCVFVCVSECVCVSARVRLCTCGWKEELMSLLWAIIRTLAAHSAIIKGNISELPNRRLQHNTRLR